MPPVDIPPDIRPLASLYACRVIRTMHQMAHAWRSNLRSGEISMIAPGGISPEITKDRGVIVQGVQNICDICDCTYLAR